MKIGNISFNLESINGITEDEFIQRYRGQLDGVDIKEAFKMLQSELNKTEPKEEKKKDKTPKVK